jgi:hypothetical protein
MGHPIEQGLYQRVAILLVLLVLGLLAALLMLDPIPQDLAYHRFADTRQLAGIPNFNDVMSNIGFAIAGVLGMLAILGAKQKLIFLSLSDTRPYIVFFVGVTLISLGSGFYHLEPSNERLFWDRLPMSISFMAFISAIIADRIAPKAGNGWLLVVLVILGMLSLVYWILSESQGNGDLRFYGFVQFFPVMLLPLILWLFPGYRYTTPRYLGWIIAWYALAKIVEHFDREIFQLTGNIISGHTLKHLAAATGAYVVARMLLERAADNANRNTG